MRRGRPPSFEGAIGPVDFHLGLRFDRLRREQLRALVAIASRKSGRRITASALVSGWIRERLDEEVRRLRLVAKTKRAAERSLAAPTAKLVRMLADAQRSERRGNRQ
jgi:hypothetical protein